MLNKIFLKILTKTDEIYNPNKRNPFGFLYFIKILIINYLILIFNLILSQILYIIATKYSIELLKIKATYLKPN